MKVRSRVMTTKQRLSCSKSGLNIARFRCLINLITGAWLSACKVPIQSHGSTYPCVAV